MDVLGGAEKKMAEAVQAAVEHLGHNASGTEYPVKE